MFEKYLEDLGLTDKEAKVYLSLLQVDHSSVLDLAKKTSIKRPTVYVTLESLAKKGLVSETTQGKKTYYLAESPERLETFIQRQKLAFDEKERRVKDVISHLRSIQLETGEKPVVKYFEGREGIISSAEELFSTKTGEGVAHMIYSKDLLQEQFPESERLKYRDLRLSKNIKSKVIYTYAGGTIPSDSMGERLKIDEKKYPISCDIAIYEDRVTLRTLGKSLGAIGIKSKDIADTLRSLCNLIHDLMKDKK